MAHFETMDLGVGADRCRTAVSLPEITATQKPEGFGGDGPYDGGEEREISFLWSVLQQPVVTFFWDVHVRLWCRRINWPFREFATGRGTEQGVIRLKR